MQDLNTSMSAVHTSVEWLLGDIINYFKLMDFKKNLIICLSAVYIVSAILRNLTNLVTLSINFKQSGQLEQVYFVACVM